MERAPGTADRISRGDMRVESGDRAQPGSRAIAEENVPNRFELFLLGDGEKKIIEEPDTRVQSASVFTFNKEDHTLGNMLRERLLRNPHVHFSGYKVPHPLFSTFELRVQTDGSITPRQALLACCKDLVNDLGYLGREFTKEWELRKMVGDNVDGGANGL
ncbi:MAG: hypothetical protein L6R40_002930 [Gallowayella cf. fulva]|nr:MAG: hypothetical protein L6R40_002930 [Xanthomendoza cf. fulva]